MNEVQIRALTDRETLRRLEDLQQRVWGMPDRDIVPMHQLLAAVSAGGVVLGAFAPGGELIGFCYAFLGQRAGRLLLYSHMAGVAEEWRGRDVGFQLKRAQRDAALARGLDWMVWTFDPLQSGNAYFNLHRLGALARRYHVNYYGEMLDDLNRGGESDRLEVDWLLRSPPVRARMAGRPDLREHAAAAEASPVVLAGSGDPFPRPHDPALDRAEPEVRLGIPLDFTALRQADTALAREWRDASRRAFPAYLDRGYAAVDFLRTPALGYYLLRRPGAD